MRHHPLERRQLRPQSVQGAAGLRPSARRHGSCRCEFWRAPAPFGVGGGDLRELGTVCGSLTQMVRSCSTHHGSSASCDRLGHPASRHSLRYEAETPRLLERRSAPRGAPWPCASLTTASAAGDSALVPRRMSRPAGLATGRGRSRSSSRRSCRLVKSKFIKTLRLFNHKYIPNGTEN